MHLDIVANAILVPGSLRYLLWVQAITLHGVINTDIIPVLEALALFHIHLTKDGIRTKIARTKATSLFIHEGYNDEIRIEHRIFFLQDTRQLNRYHHASDTIVIAAIVYRIIM